MSQNSDTEERLERLIGTALRELPPRQAPPVLESRVLQELERRAASPWWSRSITHWPLTARALFVAICVCLAGVTLLAGPWAENGFDSLHISAASMPWAHEVMVLTSIAAELLALFARTVPPDWVHDALTVSALLYAALFGLAIAAYRTLYLRPGIAGDGA
jgi:hypothetical protein